MKGNPIKQTLLVLLCWGVLAIPIYFITFRETKSEHVKINNQTTESNNAESIQTWISIKSIPNLKNIEIKQNNNLILSKKKIDNNFLEKEVKFIIEEGFIEFKINASFNDKTSCMLELTVSNSNSDDLVKNIWGEEGEINGIMEFQIK